MKQGKDWNNIDQRHWGKLLKFKVLLPPPWLFFCTM
jgi:hypothetical protein